MNIFNQVTRRTLEKNRTRTIVTIIGIILSAAMFTAVTTSVSSMMTYMRKCTIYQEGNWHGCFLDVPSEQMTNLENEEEIDSVAWAQNIGYADVDSKNDYKPYLFIMGADPLFMERMPIHLTEGRLPENSHEILLPDHLFTNGGVEYQVGNEVTFDIGDRYWGEEMLTQGVGYMPEEEGSQGEELKTRETREYTVVGFYERPDFEDYEAPGYTAITTWDDSRPTDNSAAYFRMTKPKEIYDFVSSLEETYGTGSWNSSLLRYEGVSRYDSYYSILYGLAAILIGLIMFGSISLIYNAFSISVSERTRQFGLLSSVGATKKQIRKMVFAEAAYVSIIGIPLGILCGIVGIGITFYLIGDKFYAFYGIEEVSLRLAVSPVSILVAAAVAYITVLISAWIPSRRATHVTAIEAIRQSEDIRIKAKQVKTSAFTQRVFGLEGVIARKHFKRNRRRYRATIVSLFASVVLFISASSFCSYLTEMITGVYEDYDYDISYDWGSSAYLVEDSLSLEQGAAILGQTEGVTKYSFIKSSGQSMEIPFDMIPEDSQKKLEEEGYIDTYYTYIYIYGVDSDTYNEYLEKLGLDKDRFYDSNHPLAIVMAQNREFKSSTQRYENLALLKNDIHDFTLSMLDYDKWESYVNSSEYEKATAEEAEAKNKELSYDLNLEIGAFADSLPFGLNTRFSGIAFVYPLDIFNTIVQNAAANEKIVFKTTDHVKGMENLEKTAEENGIAKEYLYDVYVNSENERNLVTIIKVFSYGFIVLISLISLANVFNTISTSVLLRRRELAMLKSVGMTEKGVRKMLSYECVLYGVKSLLFGIPVSFVVTYLIFRSIVSGYEMDFYLPWTAVSIAICSVFLVVFVTMVYAISKVKKDNLIDALKNENY